MQVNICDEYFEWLYDMMCVDRYSKEISYRKLFTRLHNIEFRYIIPSDRNRAGDGIDLRYRFAYANNYSYRAVSEYLSDPCSVLEMMVALAMRCEENIMDDPKVGNRTSQWFWGMVVNLGLGSMTDAQYDKQLVDESVRTLLNRDYKPNGEGGLFTLRHCDEDLRDVEIWMQLCWYLDEIY